MTPAEIERVLRESKGEAIAPYLITEHPAWNSFCARMNNRQYGYDALCSAWGWYSVGWHDRRTREPL